MKTVTFFIALLFSASLFAQTDEEQIRSVITSAYIEGIHNGGNVADVRAGFHPTFEMLRLVQNEIKPLPIEEWITTLEKNKKDNPSPLPRTEGKFISIDVTGTAAVVKLEIYRDNKKIFTDYLVLYKFNEGWRIVSKTFYRHP
jgi:hypothetical protein